MKKIAFAKSGEVHLPNDGLDEIEAVDRTLDYQYIQALTVFHLTPEKRLLLWVLKDAIETLRDFKDEDGQGEVKVWFESDDYSFGSFSCWPFTFFSVCESLGLSPSAIRKRLKKELDSITTSHHEMNKQAVISNSKLKRY